MTDRSIQEVIKINFDFYDVQLLTTLLGSVQSIEDKNKCKYDDAFNVYDVDVDDNRDQLIAAQRIHAICQVANKRLSDEERIRSEATKRKKKSVSEHLYNKLISFFLY